MHGDVPVYQRAIVDAGGVPDARRRRGGALSVPDTPPSMDNGQLTGLIGTLLACAGLLAGAIKWAVSRLARSQDRLADATADQAEAFTRLDSKVDTLLKIQGGGVVVPELGAQATARLRSPTATAQRRRRPAPTERNELDDGGDGGDYDGDK